jgi:hypothetical protein
MRVALLYHGRLPVERYGGTERVVVWLARGLAELGHEVVLLAGPGSRVPEARLIPIDLVAAARADFDPRPLLPAGLDCAARASPDRGFRRSDPLDPPRHREPPRLSPEHGGREPRSRAAERARRLCP